MVENNINKNSFCDMWKLHGIQVAVPMNEVFVDHRHIHLLCHYCCWVVKLCRTLCNSMDCRPPVSSVHGIFQARILEWVAIHFSRGSSHPMDGTRISCIALWSFTIWATLFLNFMRNPVWRSHSIKLLPSLIKYNKFPELSQWLLTLH